jgi:hypothetical protein
MGHLAFAAGLQIEHVLGIVREAHGLHELRLALDGSLDLDTHFHTPGCPLAHLEHLTRLDLSGSTRMICAILQDLQAPNLMIFKVDGRVHVDASVASLMQVPFLRYRVEKMSTERYRCEIRHSSIDISCKVYALGVEDVPSIRSSRPSQARPISLWFDEGLPTALEGSIRFASTLAGLHELSLDEDDSYDHGARFLDELSWKNLFRAFGASLHTFSYRERSSRERRAKKCGSSHMLIRALGATVHDADVLPGLAHLELLGVRLDQRDEQGVALVEHLRNVLVSRVTVHQTALRTLMLGGC